MQAVPLHRGRKSGAPSPEEGSGEFSGGDVDNVIIPVCEVASDLFTPFPIRSLLPK